MFGDEKDQKEHKKKEHKKADQDLTSRQWQEPTQEVRGERGRAALRAASLHLLITR